MKIIDKSRQMIRIVKFLPVFGLLASCGLGFLASQPWIANADNNQVLFIGDSIFALSGDIQKNLHRKNGGTFRNYTTSGAQIDGGILAPSVRRQFQRAISRRSDSKVVVMDGAGNDILIPVVTLRDPYDCQTQNHENGVLSDRCTNFIDDLYVEVVDLLNDMSSSGITDVVYLGYYYTKAGLLGADDLDEAVDYGDQILARACRASTVNCVFVDPRDVIKDSDIVLDGVHPSRSGSDKLADLIWSELRSRI